MHDCLTGTVGLYNSLQIGAVNDAEDLAASAMHFVPGMWLNPLLDSGNGFWAVNFATAFAAADVGCREFPHVSKIGDPSIRFEDVDVSSNRSLGMTLTMPSSAVCGIRMIFDA